MRRGRVLRRRARPMTGAEKAGAVGIGAVLVFALVGVAAGILLDRLLDFDDTLDAGGEWDEGGGVSTRWY